MHDGCLLNVLLSLPSFCAMPRGSGEAWPKTCCVVQSHEEGARSASSVSLVGWHLVIFRAIVDISGYRRYSSVFKAAEDRENCEG